MKKSKFFLIPVMILLTLLVFSCTIGDKVPTKIYIGGEYRADSSSNNQASFWTYEMESTETTLPRIDLTDGTNNSYGNGIVATEQMVYVGGSYYLAEKNAAYWCYDIKTGDIEEVDISGDKTKTKSAIEAMAIDGEDIYSAGFYNNGTDEDFAAYWKNNSDTPITLTDGTTATKINDIFVVNGVVNAVGISNYATSYQFTEGHYWRIENDTPGDPVDLPVPDGSESISANAIYISDGNIYIAGKYVLTEKIACYWRSVDGGKTFTRNDLTDGLTDDYTSGMGIYGNDSGVYVAGYYSQDWTAAKAVYWKDDGESITMVDLNESGSGYMLETAHDIFVYNGIVYACGAYDVDYQNIPALWIDDGTSISVVELEHGTDSSCANDFFVLYE